MKFRILLLLFIELARSQNSNLDNQRTPSPAWKPGLFDSLFFPRPKPSASIPVITPPPTLPGTPPIEAPPPRTRPPTRDPTQPPTRHPTGFPTLVPTTPPPTLDPTPFPVDPTSAPVEPTPIPTFDPTPPPTAAPTPTPPSPDDGPTSGSGGQSTPSPALYPSNPPTTMHGPVDSVSPGRKCPLTGSCILVPDVIYADMLDNPDRYIGNNDEDATNLADQPIGFAIAFAENLHDPGAASPAQPIGTVNGLCTKIHPSEVMLTCQLEWRIHEGTILSSGTMTDRESSMAVVGGTGIYEGVQGSLVHFRNLGYDLQLGGMRRNQISFRISHACECS